LRPKVPGCADVCRRLRVAAEQGNMYKTGQCSVRGAASLASAAAVDKWAWVLNLTVLRDEDGGVGSGSGLGAGAWGWRDRNGAVGIAVAADAYSLPYPAHVIRAVGSD